MIFLRAAILIGLLLAPVAAFGQAHQHGEKIGAYEAQLVVKGSDMTLFVLDDKDQKVDASKFTATAVVLAKGNEQETVELKPAGENKLSGKADFPVEGKFRATVTLKSGGSELGKARYSLDR